MRLQHTRVLNQTADVHSAKSSIAGLDERVGSRAICRSFCDGFQEPSSLELVVWRFYAQICRSSEAVQFAIGELIARAIFSVQSMLLVSM